MKSITWELQVSVSALCLLRSVYVNRKTEQRTIRPSSIEKVPFTKEMRKDYTILCPQMSPIHFELLEPAFRAAGYKIEVLPNDNKQAVDMGLKYVNNDACYPSLIVVGQIMDAMLSGKYEPNQTSRYHQSDRWWMPCLQLYWIYPSCFEKSRHADISRSSPST